MKQNNILSPLREIRFALNRVILRLTPAIVIRKFLAGQYLDYSTKDEHRPGHLPWRVAKFFLDRALRDGELLISRQELDAYPLAETFLQEYKSVGGHYPLPSITLTEDTGDEYEEPLTETFHTEAGAKARLHELYRFFVLEWDPDEIKKSSFFENSASVEYTDGRQFFWNIEPATI